MKKIVVIGELCHDVFVYGECKRLSPEAPVPVFNPIHSVENLGMAGNVVANINTIDSNIGISFYHSLEKITKTRYVDKKTNHLFLRVDDEPRVNRIHISETLISEIKEADAVVVSDYNKGFLSEDDLYTISKLARFAIVDTKKRMNPIHLSHFNFIKINEHEANQGVADELKEKTIVTLGPKGAMYMDTLYPSPHPKETIDVSGAGDTFLAAFVTKYLETEDVNISITFANKMSAIVVSKRGVATP
jgi:D-beta-D-heptose 7-phosphate kinase/D-beta-D-heptose 1-phosphate adenosyltransferase